MADQLERALLVAEITELQKQQSEAHIKAIYVGSTGDERATRQVRDARIRSLRLQLDALDGSHSERAGRSATFRVHMTNRRR
jgi:hypothetical protein